MQVVIRWDEFPRIQKRQNISKGPGPDNFAIPPDCQLIRYIGKAAGGIYGGGGAGGAMGGVECRGGGAFRRSAITQHHRNDDSQRTE